MAPKSTRGSEPLRRSSRLAGIDVSNKAPVQASPRRTKGQLRLPSPTAPSAKCGVKKMRCKAGRKPKSKSKANACKRRSFDICRSMESPEPMSIFGDCRFCCSDSSPERCAHNRGQPLQESNVSSFSPELVLPSVEVEEQYGNAFWKETPISPEEQRDAVMEMLAKRRNDRDSDANMSCLDEQSPEPCWSDKSQPAYGASEPFMTIPPKPAPSISFQNNAMTDKAALPSPSSTIRPLSPHKAFQKDNRSASRALHSPHVHFSNKGPYKYGCAPCNIHTVSSNDVEQCKQSLLMCGPLHPPLFRPPTPYPEVGLHTPSDASQSTSTPSLSTPSPGCGSYFSNVTMTSAASPTPATPQAVHADQPMLNRPRTLLEYQFEDYSVPVGWSGIGSPPPLAAKPLPPLSPSGTGKVALGYSMGYATEQQYGLWCNGQNGPHEYPAPPPTPMLSSRTLPDYNMPPPMYL